MAFHKPWMVRSAALRRQAFSLEKACSIGLKQGLYGGRKSSLAPAASIASRTAGTLWVERLSIMTMSPGTRPGASICRT